MATGSTAQTGSAQEAGRPQPQTTVEGGSGPFIRHTQPGYAPQYTVTGTSFGSIVTQPLVARPGYFRAFRVRHDVVGGTGSGGTAVSTGPGPDMPFSINSLVQLKDAFGTPLMVGPGYEMTNVVPVLSGGFGTALTGTLFPTSLPSSSGTATTAAIPAASGQGSFSYALPLEFAKGYGVLSGANASLLPTLQFNFNTFTSLITGITTAPTVNTTVDASFYWLPEGVAVEPPGLGTTRQWILQQANPQVSTGASVRLQMPRLGGYLDTVAFEFRDSNGTRTNQAFNTSRIQMYLDGVPVIDASVPEWYDDMAITYGLTPTNLGYTGVGGTFTSTYTPVVTGPSLASPNFAGILAVSRKTSLLQASLGLLDTGEAYLSTNPGTLVELNLAPAGTITNSPGTVSVLAGQIVPTGAIIQGLPEV